MGLFETAKPSKADEMLTFPFISGLAFAGTHFEREAQLAILIGSLLAAAVGIAIVLTSKATQAPGPK